MGEIQNTFTKTVGGDSNYFSIFQIILDTKADLRYHPDYVPPNIPLSLGITMSMLHVDGTYSNPVVNVRQHITEKDLNDLRALLWEATVAYESRKKEIQEANKAREAKGEATA